MSGKTNETIRINDTEDWDALLDEILSDADAGTRTREELYLRFLTAHADELVRATDAALPYLSVMLRGKIRTALHAAFRESGGWAAMPEEDGCVSVSGMMDRTCRNPEDRGSTACTYGQYLSSSTLPAVRQFAMRAGVYTVVCRAAKTGGRPEWAEMETDVCRELMADGTTQDEIWRILTDNHAEVVSVLADIPRALAFARCGDMPFSALMLEAEDPDRNW